MDNTSSIYLYVKFSVPKVAILKEKQSKKINQSDQHIGDMPSILYIISAPDR